MTLFVNQFKMLVGAYELVTTRSALIQKAIAFALGPPFRCRAVY